MDIANESIEIEAVFSVTGAGNSTLRLRFGGIGGTVLYANTAASLNGSNIRIQIKLYRTGAATQRAIATATDQSNLLTVLAYYSTPAQTLSNAISIVATGQNATNNNRITLRTFEVKN